MIDLTTIVHVTSDPACRHHDPQLLDAHRGLACHVCVPDPDAGRDDVLEDEGLEEDANLERPEPWLYRVGARLVSEWGGFTCWLGINHRCLDGCDHPTTHPTRALA